MKYDRKIEVLKMIAADMESDAASFDGKLFNGETVAEYFGNQGAAIAALANIVQSILEEAKMKHIAESQPKIIEDKDVEYV